MKDLSKYFTQPLAEAQRARLWACLGVDRLPWGVAESCGGVVLREGDGPEIRHPGPQLPIREISRPTDLWRECFPYPLRELEQGEGIASTRAAFTALMDALAAFEVGLLGIRGERDRMVLLLHFVRRRCVRLGTSPELEALGEKLWSGQMDAASLGESFGTRAAFFTLDLTQAPAGDGPLVRLTRALEAALPAPCPNPDPPSAPGMRL